MGGMLECLALSRRLNTKRSEELKQMMKELEEGMALSQRESVAAPHRTVMSQSYQVLLSLVGPQPKVLVKDILREKNIREKYFKSVPPSSLSPDKGNPESGRRKPTKRGSLTSQDTSPTKLHVPTKRISFDKENHPDPQKGKPSSAKAPAWKDPSVLVQHESQQSHLSDIPHVTTLSTHGISKPLQETGNLKRNLPRATGAEGMSGGRGDRASTESRSKDNQGKRLKDNKSILVSENQIDTASLNRATSNVDGTKDSSSSISQNEINSTLSKSVGSEGSSNILAGNPSQTNKISLMLKEKDASKEGGREVLKTDGRGRKAGKRRAARKERRVSIRNSILPYVVKTRVERRKDTGAGVLSEYSPGNSNRDQEEAYIRSNYPTLAMMRQGMRRTLKDWLASIIPQNAKQVQQSFY
jgi:hypothetical protein